MSSSSCSKPAARARKKAALGGRRHENRPPVWTVRPIAAPSPSDLEPEAQSRADLARAADDREVVAPDVARVEAAVHVQLVGEVLAPDLDAVVALRGLVDETRVQDPVGGLEHGLAVRIDLRSL